MSRTVKSLTVAALAAAALTLVPLTSEATTTEAATSDLSVLSAGDGTVSGAIEWFQNRNGSSAYEGMCEKAVENAYGTTGVWSSANAHWEGASPKHAGDHNPPRGAFVYWNIGGGYGHVGISDGAGGFWSTSVNNKIGHVTKAMGGYDYFGKYRGWTPAAVPSR
ncbi:CHAP domain-containing protein [Amycolatopsis granulosa]|uniref:CHAP domain-containing protein n=1 Tax=Amycolatopsis granulosa TaxID=185684 RepID=UPI001423A246|nr:CHAP domain-containing protein [Amycolatopsis granulosa]NIH85097.1 hypothetical protein [Amycolatopsis granulosa]